MKKLGLVGGTGPESTLVYYREINRLMNMRTNGKAFPEISIESVNLYRALGYVSDERYEELSRYLLDAINNLVNGGAEVVALTAGTMHVVYDELKDKVHVPFISIPDAVSEEAVLHNYNKVGLLGTIFTMRNDFFKKAFSEKGIDIVTPSDEDMLLVNERISKELEYGIVKDSTREELIGIIARMKEQQGIEAVILGCTELPLLLSANNCPVDCLDIMDIHINKLVRLMTD
ncbi:MAG: amino acid racemase [Lachnospiraceae bacterium]|nr:amino acid racemase [Lachnospiraceae bacterium]